MSHGTTWDDAVVELRQYLVHTELRHQLIDVFDEAFVDGQERDGMHVIGQFADLDRNDRFVWLRGFASMEQRLASLTAFYSGVVWKQHSQRANATMIDVDDVLLLQPAGLWDLPSAKSGSRRVIEIVLCPLADPLSDTVVARVCDAARTTLDAPIGVLTTLHAENTFPALPVRDGDEHLVVVHARPPVPDAAPDATRVVAAVAEVEPFLRAPISRVRLLPTDASALR